MNHFALTALLLCSLFSYGQEPRPEIHCKHFFYGYPYGTPASNDLVIRDVYALSNNDATKFADWVAYRLTYRDVIGDLTVSRVWKSDPWLDPSETLSNNPDYKDVSSDLHMDRGHQAPLASFKGCLSASHTNYLSNITPQKDDLNRGPWKKLEDAVRDLVYAHGTVYVMTGPLYEREMPQLPHCEKHHQVPSGYWKIIAIQEKNDIQLVAFLFDQDTPRDAAVMDYLVSVDEVEQRSGLDFLWVLPDELEEELEESVERALLEAHL
ncbi:MAG: DNA/RNA non-specific endonuclease [Leptolyngbya sp. SIO3F4]|nr:DNA/RNA non-specific endonuclease [Leptolyngbya sp. SIO3F4]